MLFLITLIATVALTFLLKTPIKRLPWLFYLLAIVVTVVFLARGTIQLPAIIDRPFFMLMQKATLAEALFVVVMFIGVFDVKSKIRSWFQPIRAELSIFACIIALGHIAAYLTSFGVRIFVNSGSYNGFLLSSFVIALVLFALLLILGFTSFEVIKKRMKTKSWKKVQYLAYAFYALTYVHILLFLLPPAIGG
ncbi:MAG TPA: hypothetical protein DEB24_00195, partial [Coriobacteriia bacterium]|nr:hypothetical protein [Coriobacteriia bacterium]